MNKSLERRDYWRIFFLYGIVYATIPIIITEITWDSLANMIGLSEGLLATEQGLLYEGIGSKTKWYFYTNALIREFVANLVQERKGHIILILINYLYRKLVKRLYKHGIH